MQAPAQCILMDIDRHQLLEIIKVAPSVFVHKFLQISDVSYGKLFLATRTRLSEVLVGWIEGPIGWIE